MKQKINHQLQQLKRSIKIWESSNGKWRIAKHPKTSIISIEKLTRVRRYIKLSWDYRDTDEADVPRYVLNKLNQLISSKGYVYDLFGSRLIV